MIVEAHRCIPSCCENHYIEARKKCQSAKIRRCCDAVVLRSATNNGTLRRMDDTPHTFEEIYRRYHKPITAYMNRMVGQSDADDVTQEIFAKIDRGLQHFKGQAKLSTWIYRIATNTALDRLRRSRRQQPETELMEEIPLEPPAIPQFQSASISSPLQQVIHTEMNDCIREQVDKLAEKYRTVMILSSLEELKNPEIAEILDISVENVKIRLHRARAMLKKILETQCNFYRNADTGALSCDRKS